MQCSHLEESPWPQLLFFFICACNAPMSSDTDICMLDSGSSTSIYSSFKNGAKIHVYTLTHTHQIMAAWLDASGLNCIPDHYTPGHQIHHVFGAIAFRLCLCYFLVITSIWLYHKNIYNYCKSLQAP